MGLVRKETESRPVENRRRTLTPLPEEKGAAPAKAKTRPTPQAPALTALRAKLGAASNWPKVIGPADGLLLGTVVALVAFGVVMVYSASAVLAYSHFDDGQHYLVRQGVFALAGLPLMVVLARVDYHRYRPFTYPMLLGAVALLAATAFGLGKTAGGAARWISVGPVHVQPAEIVKVVMIFWLAYSLSKKADRIRSFTVGFLPHVLMAGFLMILCLKQPDFGSAVMIAFITFVMLFTAGTRIAYIGGAALLAAPLAWWAITGTEYRMRRVMAFLEPFKHRYGAGYQIAESMMSFGAGGVTGVGIGDSRQKLFFLPEAHTDFISAIVAEELGLVGLSLMVIAYIVIVHRGVMAAFRAADDYGAYLAVGVSMFVGLQAFTNLAVVMGVLPTKGLVLPFMSYGGSSLLVNCAAMGVLLNVSRPRQGGALPPPEPQVVSGPRVSKSKSSSRRSNVRIAQAGGVA